MSPIKPIKDDVGNGNGNGNGTVEVETDVKRKRHTTDRAYFIAKEMLMTERTYKKDLSVINVVSDLDLENRLMIYCCEKKKIQPFILSFLVVQG